jgi:S-adenosylmethionine synthetase
MGVRRNDHLELTIACAFIDRHIADANDYMRKKARLTGLVEAVTRNISNKALATTINAADNPETGSLYMTVTGTSAESGDDGEVGRGNRVNGLITPYRPMNMEAAAGKNPVTHVGKLYNIVAQQIADSLVRELEEVSEAYCYLLSQIGSPINEPRIIDLHLRLYDGKITDDVRSRAREIVDSKLSDIYMIRQALITRSIQVY